MLNQRLPSEPIWDLRGGVRCVDPSSLSMLRMGSPDSEKEWMADESVTSVEEYKKFHSQHVKEILGDHYDYILEQREAFIHINSFMEWAPLFVRGHCLFTC